MCRNCNIFQETLCYFLHTPYERAEFGIQPFQYHFLSTLIFILRRQMYVQRSSLRMHTSASLHLVCFTSDHFFHKEHLKLELFSLFHTNYFQQNCSFFGELNGFLCSHMDNNYTSPNTNLVKMFNTKFTLCHTRKNVQIT